jgi:hypothetical protein
LKANSDVSIHRPAATLLAVVLTFGPVSTRAADLRPATAAAFDRYAQLTQAQFDSENKQLNSFLWVDRLPADRREVAYSQLGSGQVVIDRLQTLDAGKPIAIPNGIIHHWVGTVFIPRATLAQVLAFEEDYDHQEPYFTPNVLRSKTLSHSGDNYTVEIRFHEKKVITVVLETVHQVHYAQIDKTHAWSQSSTTHVQQVDRPGEPTETLEAEGHDDGFLWRMNSYWRFEEKDGGVYVESQSVSLTRDIPTGLGWMVGPFVTSIPRESLVFMLGTTRSAVLQKTSHTRTVSRYRDNDLEARRTNVDVLKAARISTGDHVRGA